MKKLSLKPLILKEGNKFSVKKIVLLIAGATLLTILIPLVISPTLFHILHIEHATGNTYYVSKNGNNADGLSWTTAWNDVNKINWSALNPGDTIVIDGGATACPSNYDFVSVRP